MTPETTPAVLPVTPRTTVSANMDSDDEFNSSQVSDEEIMDDSDVDGFDDGKHNLCKQQDIRVANTEI